MIRKIVSINEERCNGCGLCAKACHEGAIAMINGKAKLIRDDYCDGLGDCLPACPMDAIRIIEREAAAYDEEAVKARQAEKSKSAASPCGGHSCPGSRAKTFVRPTPVNAADPFSQPMQSQLSQWPVQIRLVAPNAPYFENAHITCIDYSMDMLEQARKRLGSHAHIKCIQGDVGNLQMENESVDTVVSMNGFHAFPDKQKAFHEI